MRAQLSLEMLLVLAIILTALSVLIPLEESLREKLSASAQDTATELSLARLASAAEQAFLLGSGNSRDINAVSLAGKTLTISDGKIETQGLSGILEATGSFRSAQNSLFVPGNASISIACCSEGNVIFSSTVLP